MWIAHCTVSAISIEYVFVVASWRVHVYSLLVPLLSFSLHCGWKIRLIQMKMFRYIIHFHVPCSTIRTAFKWKTRCALSYIFSLSFLISLFFLYGCMSDDCLLSDSLSLSFFVSRSHFFYFFSTKFSEICKWLTKTISFSFSCKILHFLCLPVDYRLHFDFFQLK